MQGEPVELGGYYLVDRDKATAVMRPSATFNAALAEASVALRLVIAVADVPAAA